MTAYPMSIISITGLSIARLATTLFKWAWDSNHYVSLMWPWHLQLLKQIRLMSSLKPIRQIASLSTSNMFVGRSMTFWRNQMPSTSNAMINIECHTSFTWTTKSSCICKTNALLENIGNSDHSDMLHHYQGYGRQCIWAQHSPIHCPAPSVECGPPLTILPTVARHIRHCRTTHT